MERNKVDKRVGETRTMNNGMEATIIAYYSYHDIDVQFKDGCLKEHIHYRNFAKGEVAHPNGSASDHIGEIRTMNNGMKATIIVYRSHADIDIQFEDGQVREHVSRGSFVNGQVTHPSCTREGRIGETRTMNNGMSATIIAYRSYQDIDVQFEDGQIKRSVIYSAFRKGHVAHPKSRKQTKEEKCRKNTSRVGETRTMNNGMSATITAYHSSYNIDIQFEDGQTRESVSYGHFARGKVAHPNSTKISRVGETRTMNNGMSATIIAYRSSKDMDVQFEGEQIKKNIKYDNFLKGRVNHPSVTGASRVGETRTMNNGMNATIIAYRSSMNIDIKFEDDQIRNGIPYDRFVRGEVGHPLISTRSISKESVRIGETRTMSNGMSATIVAYRSYQDIDVQFEDGRVREHVRYGHFANGKIAHPLFCRKNI